MSYFRTPEQLSRTYQKQQKKGTPSSLAPSKALASPEEDQRRGVPKCVGRTACAVLPLPEKIASFSTGSSNWIVRTPDGAWGKWMLHGGWMDDGVQSNLHTIQRQKHFSTRLGKFFSSCAPKGPPPRPLPQDCKLLDGTRTAVPKAL